MPRRYARPPLPVSMILAMTFALILVLCSTLWCSAPQPLPPLADDAQRYGDCTIDPEADGCAVWPR